MILGSVYHSTTLIGDSKFKVLTEYIGATSHNLLMEMGFDLRGYQVFTTEMWVQEFAKEWRWTPYIYIHIGMVTSLVFIF